MMTPDQAGVCVWWRLIQPHGDGRQGKWYSEIFKATGALSMKKCCKYKAICSRFDSLHALFMAVYKFCFGMSTSFANLFQQTVHIPNPDF